LKIHEIGRKVAHLKKKTGGCPCLSHWIEKQRKLGLTDWSIMACRGGGAKVHEYMGITDLTFAEE